MEKINMKKALSLKYTPKYARYMGSGYPSGEGLSLIIEDMCKTFETEYKDESTGTIIARITGNNVEDSDHPDYDHMVKINKTYAWYTNNAYNAVKKFKK